MSLFLGSRESPFLRVEVSTKMEAKCADLFALFWEGGKFPDPHAITILVRTCIFTRWLVGNYILGSHDWHISLPWFKECVCFFSATVFGSSQNPPKRNQHVRLYELPIHTVSEKDVGSNFREVVDFPNGSWPLQIQNPAGKGHVWRVQMTSSSGDVWKIWDAWIVFGFWNLTSWKAAVHS